MSRTQVTSVQTLVMAHLTSKEEWRPFHICLDIAARDYDTAAGERSALIYCRPSSDNPGDHFLTASYMSEGYNALSTTFRTIPEGLSEPSIRRLVDDYAKAVDARVRQTYAMRIKAMMDREAPNEAAEDSESEAPRMAA